MVGRSWRNRFPRFFFREGGKKFTKRGGRGGGGGEGEKTGGSLRGGPSSLRREIRAARPLIWIEGGEGAAILEAKNGKAKRKPAKKSRDSRVGSTLVKRGKRGGGGGGEEEGWRRDNRCIKIPNLNERSFRSSSNGGLSTVACFLSNDLTTIFETIAALSRVACPPYRIQPVSLYSFLFFFLLFGARI